MNPNHSPFSLLMFATYALVAVHALVVSWRLRRYEKTIVKQVLWAALGIGIGGRVLTEQISTNPWSLFILAVIFGVQLSDHASVPTPQANATRQISHRRPSKGTA